MTPKRRTVFLDTSVIFAAVLSPAGGARTLFQLAEAGLLKLIAGPNVLCECDEVVRRKAPSSLPMLAQLLATGQVETSQASTSERVAMARLYVKCAPDAHILAEAINAGPDWFVTHDKVHLLKVRTANRLSLKIGTPGDLIQELKDDFTLP